MSRMLTTLAPHLPADVEIPDEIEQAWLWMEGQGWSIANDRGYFLTPYPGSRVLGAVFCELENFLEAWFDAEPPASRLVPIGNIGGDGSAAALWLDDDGRLRFVAMGSEGDAYVLADSAVEFLRLVAVGYPELTSYELGLPPDDEESVTALAPFRAWVEETFDVVVPAEWPAVGDDEFTDWVNQVNGMETPDDGPRPQPDDSPGADAVSGTARTLLGLIGSPDGAAALRTVATTVDLAVPRGIPDLRWAGAELRSVGLEVTVRRGDVETIFVRVAGDGASYPRPEELLEGLPPTASSDDVTALLGEPEWRGPRGLRYVVDGRYLHVGLCDAGIERLTLMREAP